MIAGILGLAGSVIDGIFKGDENHQKRSMAKLELERVLIQNEFEIAKAAAGVVQAEAASTHWLAANWRPLTMITFVLLIVSRWLGFAAEGMTEAEYLSIYDIIKIGLGGYVGGRTIEKVSDKIAPLFKGKGGKP